jgi:hypothetical protein
VIGDREISAKLLLTALLLVVWGAEIRGDSVPG